MRLSPPTLANGIVGKLIPIAILNFGFAPNRAIREMMLRSYGI
jgi:hypothetical protein